MDNELLYRRLPQSAVYVSRPLGVIRITGESRLDLIDRMSTQKVKQLQPGEGAATVLTTDIGRIIDRLLVYVPDEDSITAVTGENNAADIIGYLQRFVFFNDDFHMQNRTADTVVITVYGGRAAQMLGLPRAAEWPRHHGDTHEIGGANVHIHRTDPIGGDGFLLLVPTADVGTVTAALEEADIPAVDDDTFDYLRVRAAVPRFGREMTGDYIPLETGLWEDVSFNKGCYVGQEIIARMESRGRLAKKLVQLHAPAALETGSEITADGRPVGTVTSAAGDRALAYVKMAALEKEKPLTVGGMPVEIA